MRATPTAVSPAQWAFHFSAPRVTKIVSSGRIASRDDHRRLSATGAISGVKYQADAAARSWRGLTDFLAELFG